MLLENDGTGVFTDAAQKGGAFFRTKFRGRGSAVLDFDNDGRLDVLVTALADRPFLLRNRCPVKNHWLKLELEGTRSNRSGYGALITLTAGDLTSRAEALLAVAGLVVDLVGEGLQIAELRVTHDDHIAAPAPIAAVRPVARNVHLPTKRNAAVPAVPGRHVDLCLIEEHGRRRAASPAALERRPKLYRYSMTMLMTRPILPVVNAT